MKNYEKYADKIRKLEGAAWCAVITKPKVLEPLGIKCEDISCAQCSIITTLWLLEEYKEPEVDWSKVKIDTPILVRDFQSNDWAKRYFAKYENGTVFAWEYGRTSWSSNSTDNVTGWKYAKLTETEDAE